MKTKRTKEEVKDYYASIKREWKEAKELWDVISAEQQQELLEIQWIIPQMSATWYMFCKRQMSILWLEWLPWVDTKTFKLRKDSWYVVKKWQKSVIIWLTRIKVEREDDEEFMYPKLYKLFHRDQVEKI